MAKNKGNRLKHWAVGLSAAAALALFASAAVIISYGSGAVTDRPVVLSAPPSEPLAAESAESNGARPITLENGEMLYAKADIRSERKGYAPAGAAFVLAEVEDGWVNLRTAAGEGWANILHQKIYIEHYYEGFAQAAMAGKSTLVPPGEYEMTAKSKGDWYRLAHDGGELWADISAIPRRLELDAPLYDQMPDYRNGCESFSAAMALSRLGVDVTPVEFIALVPQNITKQSYSGGKMVWGDPDCEFVGSMSGEGYAVYPPVLEKVINENFAGRAAAEDVSGAGFDGIVAELSRGAAVLLWYFPSGGGNTREWLNTDGELIQADFSTHTVCAVGYDLRKGTIIFNDPIGALRKETEWSRLEETYKNNGSRALSIRPGS